MDFTVTCRRNIMRNTLSLENKMYRRLGYCAKRSLKQQKKPFLSKIKMHGMLFKN